MSLSVIFLTFKMGCMAQCPRSHSALHFEKALDSQYPSTLRNRKNHKVVGEGLMSEYMQTT